MKKLPLCVAAIILTHFALKVVRKLKHPEQLTKEETYSQMKKAEYDARRAAARPVIAKLDIISTSRDSAKWLASIGTVQQMRDSLRPSNDQCDAMAMAPGRFA